MSGATGGGEEHSAAAPPRGKGQHAAAPPGDKPQDTTAPPRDKPQSMAAPPRDGKPKRPISVTIVSLVALAVAAYNIAYGVLAVESGDDDRLVEGIYYLAFGAGALIASVGAFLLQAWAWAAFMTWAVIGLTLQILRHAFFEDPDYLAMALNTFAVLAMSPLEVQVAFGLRHTGNVQLARPTRNPLDRD